MIRMKTPTILLLAIVLAANVAPAQPRQCRTCIQDLTACQSSLSISEADFLSCQSQLAACRAQPPTCPPGPSITFGPTVNLSTSGSQPVSVDLLLPVSGPTEWSITSIYPDGTIAAKVDWLAVGMDDPRNWRVTATPVEQSTGQSAYTVVVTNGTAVYKQTVTVTVQ